jgi:hypothetical protein
MVNRCADVDLPQTDRLAMKFLNLPCGQLVDTVDIVQIVEMLHFIYKNAELIAERLNRKAEI